MANRGRRAPKRLLDETISVVGRPRIFTEQEMALKNAVATVIETKEGSPDVQIIKAVVDVAFKNVNPKIIKSLDLKLGEETEARNSRILKKQNSLRDLKRGFGEFSPFQASILTKMKEGVTDESLQNWTDFFEIAGQELSLVRDNMPSLNPEVKLRNVYEEAADKFKRQQTASIARIPTGQSQDFDGHIAAGENDDDTQDEF